MTTLERSFHQFDFNHGRGSRAATTERVGTPIAEDEPRQYVVAGFRRVRPQVAAINNRECLPPNTSALIIHPQSKNLQRWDVVTLVALAFTALATPVEVAFIEKTTVDALFIINRIIDVVFILDLIRNFFTAFFDEDRGCWVHTAQGIRRAYSRGWFAIDLLSCVPFDLFSVVGSAALSRARAISVLQRWEHRISLSYSVRALVKFLLGVLVCSHWMVCAYRLVAALAPVTKEGELWSWVIAYRLDPSDVGACYIASLYWAIMTLTTIGYGDIPAQSTPERAVACVCMLVGAGLFAYIVGSICGIIAGMDRETAEYHSQMDLLNEYLDDNKVPYTLKREARAYYINSRPLRREGLFKDVLCQLSPQVLGKLLLFVYSDAVYRVPFFRLNKSKILPAERDVANLESAAFVRSVASVLVPMAFGPLEDVVVLGETAEAMYLMKSGLVGKRGTIYNKDMYFGEDMVLTDYKRPYSVRTLSFVHLLKLPRADLIALMDSGHFPRTRATIRTFTCYQMLRNSLVTYANRVKTLSVIYPRTLSLCLQLSKVDTFASPVPFGGASLSRPALLPPQSQLVLVPVALTEASAELGTLRHLRASMIAQAPTLPHSELTLAYQYLGAMEDRLSKLFVDTVTAARRREAKEAAD